METEIFEKTANLISKAEVFILLTGAGMSADSGIPTYRGENGSWGRVEKEINKPVTEVMTPQFIDENPVYMWQRFSRGWTYLQNVKPHLGHTILLKWIEQFRLDYFAVTSNVDVLLQKAGFSTEKVYEVHGASGYLQCTVPCWDKVWQEDYSGYHLLENLSYEMLPKCPNCGKLVRPNIYIFKDKTFVATRIKIQKTLFQDFLDKNRQKEILVLEIGSGPTIQTIRAISRRLARENKAQVIRINPHDSAIEAPHIAIPLSALDALREVDKYLEKGYK